MKIVPASMSIEQALRAGYLGRLTCRPYLDWLKTLPCDTCGRAPNDPTWPIDPSHFNGYKGAGTKAPDGMAIPQCRLCHNEYEDESQRHAHAISAATGHKVNVWEAKHGPFLARVAIYNAIWISDQLEQRRA